MKSNYIKDSKKARGVSASGRRRIERYEQSWRKLGKRLHTMTSDERRAA